MCLILLSTKKNICDIFSRKKEFRFLLQFNPFCLSTIHEILHKFFKGEINLVILIPRFCLLIYAYKMLIKNIVKLSIKTFNKLNFLLFYNIKYFFSYLIPLWDFSFFFTMWKALEIILLELLLQPTLNHVIYVFCYHFVKHSIL